MTSFTRAFAAALSIPLLLLVIGCEKGHGDLRQDCYPNNTCNEGLTCAGGICVSAGAVAQGQADEASEIEEPGRYANPRQPEQGDETRSGEDSGANAAQQALDAYRRHYAAWNRHDASAYFASYATTLDCYYDEANAPVQRLQDSSRGRHFRERGNTRLRIRELEVLSQSADEVRFRDLGTYTEDGATRDHEKVVVMRRIGGRWRIVIEVSRSASECAPTAFRTARVEAQDNARCSDIIACYQRCDREIDDVIMACRAGCGQRFEASDDCVSEYDSQTQPCEAARECADLCIRACPGGACNGAERCADRCAERFATACPSAFRGRIDRLRK